MHRSEESKNDNLLLKNATLAATHVTPIQCLVAIAHVHISGFVLAEIFDRSP